MPVYMTIDRLSQTVTIVAHGTVSDAEIRKTAQDLLAADVASFGKIMDTSASSTNETAEQVAAIARMMREAPDHEERGPVACVVDPNHPGAAGAFAEQTGEDRPIKLFTSLREARRWMEQVMADRER